MPHKYIQPQFSIQDSDRGIFSSEAEVASIFCLAEERRKKKGFLSNSEEKIVAILKTNYPIYAVKWRNRCILFDGLGTISENVTLQNIVDLNNFEKEMENISKVGPLRAFLTKNTNTFNQFNGNRKIKFNYIVSSNSFLSEMTDFITKSSLKTPTKDTAVIFRVENQVIQQTVSDFDNLVIQVERDIELLEKVTKNLRSSADRAIQKIQDDKQKDIEKNDKELNELKPEIDEKIKDILVQQNKEIQNLTNILNNESAALNEKKLKYEKEMRKTTKLEEEANAEKKTLSQHGDLVGVTYWNNETLKNKDITANILSLIKKSAESLEKIQFRHDANLKRLNEKFEKQVEKVKEQLYDVETKSIVSTDMKDLIIKELEHRCNLMSAQISKLIESKLKDKEKLYEMTTTWKPNKSCVILVPLYISKNELGEKTRYNVFAPSIVKSCATFKKSRRTFSGLDTKISYLLSPVGKEYNEFFINNFENLMMNNKKFEEAILKVSEKTNLFKKNNRGKLFSEGFNSLKKEGWLNNQEYKRMLIGLNLSFKLASSDNLDFVSLDSKENSTK